MGFGMSLKSLTTDTIMSKAYSSADRDGNELILAAQREYAQRNEHKNYSMRNPGTAEVCAIAGLFAQKHHQAVITSESVL